MVGEPGKFQVSANLSQQCCWQWLLWRSNHWPPLVVSRVNTTTHIIYHTQANLTSSLHLTYILDRCRGSTGTGTGMEREPVEYGATSEYLTTKINDNSFYTTKNLIHRLPNRLHSLSLFLSIPNVSLDITYMATDYTNNSISHIPWAQDESTNASVRAQRGIFSIERYFSRYNSNSLKCPLQRELGKYYPTAVCLSRPAILSRSAVLVPSNEWFTKPGRSVTPTTTELSAVGIPF